MTTSNLWVSDEIRRVGNSPVNSSGEGMSQNHQIYVERQRGRDVEAMSLAAELRSVLHLPELDHLRLISLYEISGLYERELRSAAQGILYEAPTDRLLTSFVPLGKVIAREYLPGQFDQRADSAERCLRLLWPDRKIEVKRADIFVLSGRLDDEAMKKIRSWLINPVDSRPKDLKTSSLGKSFQDPLPIQRLDGFVSKKTEDLNLLRSDFGLALNTEDLAYIRDWFAQEESRDPTLAELRTLDTYWSDHCRHTTFETELESVRIAPGPDSDDISEALSQWDDARAVCGRSDHPRTLMDLATIAAREAKHLGLVDDWDVSQEINACTLKVDAQIDGEICPWLLSFKNETHNHPTEIEPYGGASTCLGGAVRDPLSGRAYVHQALRVTGGADPRRDAAQTRPGKLPQRFIAHGAAEGYAGYGNQLGLACAVVREHYHPGYEAKRLECGAVMGASPADHVVREVPDPGDVVILVGGRTGRDGIGGATGSSVAHDGSSLEKAGAEVQKGECSRGTQAPEIVPESRCCGA
jgi:phosphoribosylformylglycinamidine synthase